jgi:hypothetical protein
MAGGPACSSDPERIPARPVHRVVQLEDLAACLDALGA